MGITVLPLPSADIDQAGEVLSRAFVTDELFEALFPDPAKRWRQTRAYCRWTLRSHVVAGAVVETTSSGRGVCIWQPPNHRFPWWVGLRTAPDTLAVLRAAGQATARAFGWFAEEERMRRALVPQAHWFLVMLGVDPAAQQYGLGAALALHGLVRADSQRVPAYLLTNTEDHVRLYTKMGFRVAGHTSAREDRIGIDTWRMVRPPCD